VPYCMFESFLYSSLLWDVVFLYKTYYGVNFLYFFGEFLLKYLHVQQAAILL
jgi:hypothetical protein